jgi:hypothetical protein
MSGGAARFALAEERPTTPDHAEAAASPALAREAAVNPAPAAEAAVATHTSGSEAGAQHVAGTEAVPSTVPAKATAPHLAPAPDVLLDNYVIDIDASPESGELIAMAAFDVTTGSESGLDSLCFLLHDELNVDNVYDKQRKQLKFTQGKEYYSLNYSLEANKVCVRLAQKLARGDTLRLSVFYQGKFSEYPLRSVADFMRFKSDGLFLRGPGYSAWFPTTAVAPQEMNTLASFDVEVRVPLDWKAVCEGEPSSSRNPRASFERSAPFRWVTKEGIPISSAVLLASNYDTLSAHVGRQTLSCWYFPSREDSSASAKLFEATKEQLGFFAKNYGDYEGSSSPPRFTLVEMPLYGDFSSGTIMGISKGRVREASSPQKRAELASLIASKMVRKFTVPAVDSSAPGAAFLLESIPSYGYVPAIEATFGKQFVLEGSQLIMRRYLVGRKKAEAGESGFPPEKPLAEVLVSEIPRYKDIFLLEDRGAFVLHMLRKLVGDENFCLVIRSYMAAFTGPSSSVGGENPGPSSIPGENLGPSSSVATSIVVGSGDTASVNPEGNPAVNRAPNLVVSGEADLTSEAKREANRPVSKRARLEDFTQIAEAASGQRLDWFFSEWLYGDVLPDYRIADMKVKVSRDTTFVDVKVENIGTGLMPVPVTLFTDKGQRTSEVWLAAHESAQMRFITRSKPKRVEIDPQKWILQADISNDGLDVSLPGAGKK